MRVMVLDGQYSHSVPIAAELSRELGAGIIGVAPNRRSHLHRSRYVDLALTAPVASDPCYLPRLVELIEQSRPDVVIPVGYSSFRKLLDSSKRLLGKTKVVIPPVGAFEVAESKSKTYSLAKELGIRVPEEYAFRLNDSVNVNTLQYPLFLKARMERGGASTAFIQDAEQLLNFDTDTLGGDVIAQEFIDGDPFTYAHCAYFRDGVPVKTFQHIELKSVPRRGGSGTRVKRYSSVDLLEQGNRLLRSLKWDGVAQVEFKRDRKGALVLMEINPKFWASYAFASRSGAHLVAEAVAAQAGFALEGEARATRRIRSMVFPFREIGHVSRNIASENILQSVRDMVWPPAALDFEIRDIASALPLRGASSYEQS